MIILYLILYLIRTLNSQSLNVIEPGLFAHKECCLDPIKTNPSILTFSTVSSLIPTTEVPSMCKLFFFEQQQRQNAKVNYRLVQYRNQKDEEKILNA